MTRQLTDPFISLVLATVGRCDQLGRLVDSLALQSFNDFELVVVDQNLDQRIESQVQRGVVRFAGQVPEALPPKSRHRAKQRN